MTTITLELPEHLAEKLRRHQDKLPRILELGLAHLVKEESLTPDARAHLRQKILAAWQSTGLVMELNPQIWNRYWQKPPRQRHTPISAEGKPASEIIIEQRRSL